MIPGVIGRGGWSMDLMPPPLRHEPGRALLVSDFQEEHDAAKRVQNAVFAEGLDVIQFVVKVAPTGRVLLYLIETGPSIESGLLADLPGTAILAEGAVPEPWRRRPEPGPQAPAPSADPELLERLPREQVPGAEGATDADIDAAQERLGFDFPEELKVLYRVMGSRAEAQGGRGDQHPGDEDDDEDESDEDLAEAAHPGLVVLADRRMVRRAAQPRPCGAPAEAAHLEGVAGHHRRPVGDLRDGRAGKP